ncbi:hypothetical protein FBU30_003068 [Linnemannia zychae]|nr:hypothetical protein FBU30_003068 [Linnemannia zychae]
MKSEKTIFLRHIVAALALSTPSWITFAQGLKFSPIKEITLGNEVTVDWTGQPSLGNVEQSVVLMKDGNALLTLCQGQITGSGQCTFELRPEHQVLGDGYQLAMQGMDGVALDYSTEFSIKAAETETKPSSKEDKKVKKEKKEKKEKKTKNEKKIKKEADEGEDKDEDEDEDKDEDDEGKEEKEDASSRKHKNKAHSEEEDDDDDEDTNTIDSDGLETEDIKTKKKDYRESEHCFTQKSEIDDHYQDDQENDKFSKQADYQVKQNFRKQVQQQRFSIQSTNPEKRAKEALRLLEKNRRRQRMLIAARRHKHLRQRQLALGLRSTIGSIFDKLTPPSVLAADASESHAAEANVVGIQPVLGNDASVEQLPERSVLDTAVKAAAKVIGDDSDELDALIADEIDINNNNPAIDNLDDKNKEMKYEKAVEDKKEKEKKGSKDKKNGKNAKGSKDNKKAQEDRKEESSNLEKWWDGIKTFSQSAGDTLAKGFLKFRQIVADRGPDEPQGEL